MPPGTRDRSLAQATALAHALPDAGIALPARVYIAPEDDPEGFALAWEGLRPRAVLGRERLEQRVARLAQLFAAGVPEVPEASGLDLRFADQVVLRQLPAPEGAASVAAERGRAKPSDRRPAG